MFSKSENIEIEGGSVIREEGSFVVKENRGVANSRDLSLSYVRFRAHASNTHSPVFILTGGPGHSNFVESGSAEFLKYHDIILVGYRGIDSNPSLSCPQFPAENGFNKAYDEAHYRRLGQALVKDMTELKRLGVDTAGYTMREVVQDVEDLRQHLGLGRIDLISSRYGSRLASFYAQIFPENVGRIVMRGANPPGYFVYHPKATDRVFFAI